MAEIFLRCGRERWREEFGRALIRVDVAPADSDIPFWAEATLQNLPGVRLAECAGSRMLMNRTAALVAADSHEADTIGLVVNTGAAPMLVRQRSAEVMLPVGGAVLVRHDEACALNTAGSHIGFVLPRVPIVLRSNDLDAAILRPISRDEAALRLLLNYVRLVREDPNLESPALQQVVVDHVHDLAALVVGAVRGNRGQLKESVGASRLKQAIAYIGKHFVDPNLTIASVANSQNISARYLQELLEQSGASFTARVNELRLKRAFALLVKFPDRPVATIALEAGFSNVSHFNRQFRQRFGDTPTGARGS